MHATDRLTDDEYITYHQTTPIFPSAQWHTQPRLSAADAAATAATAAAAAADAVAAHERFACSDVAAALEQQQSRINNRDDDTGGTAHRQSRHAHRPGSHPVRLGDCPRCGGAMVHNSIWGSACDVCDWTAGDQSAKCWIGCGQHLAVIHVPPEVRREVSTGVVTFRDVRRYFACEACGGMAKTPADVKRDPARQCKACGRRIEDTRVRIRVRLCAGCRERHQTQLARERKRRGRKTQSTCHAIRKMTGVNP